jgi:2-polyprenyl-6-methoxyphenol hydroxylase-like FAD-dependent oxidoreductase
MTRILIAGAGIGGLALAQALRKKSDHDVVVYERDPSPRTRNQGYRLHLDPDGNAALRACLPTEVLDLVRRTSGVKGDLVAGFDQRLTRTFAQEFPGIPDEEITHVDRETFRRGLLTGLEETVHFGRTVVGYAPAGRGVTVRLADGGTDSGDLLVGADGYHSAIRRQLLPQATVRDLGLRCVYGRMVLDGTTDALVPADFDRGFCWVAGDNGFGAGFAPVRFRTRPDESTTDYLMITLVGSADRIDDTLAPQGLQRLAVEATAQWHPTLRELFVRGEAFFPITIRAAERFAPWEPGPVTLLGDAAHTMPPTGGVGANTALRDAADLAEALLADPAHGNAAYERVMLPRGFDTVEHSLRIADQLLTRA